MMKTFEQKRGRWRDGLVGGGGEFVGVGWVVCGVGVGNARITLPCAAGNGTNRNQALAEGVVGGIRKWKSCVTVGMRTKQRE